MDNKLDIGDEVKALDHAVAALLDAITARVPALSGEPEVNRAVVFMATGVRRLCEEVVKISTVHGIFAGDFRGYMEKGSDTMPHRAQQAYFDETVGEALIRMHATLQALGRAERCVGGGEA
jgi:hypothetical protein